MYDSSGKNHLVLNQYCVVLWNRTTIKLYNVHYIRKINGFVYINFFQNKTEPLIIKEDEIVDIFKETIERTKIL